MMCNESLRKESVSIEWSLQNESAEWVCFTPASDFGGGGLIESLVIMGK